MPKVFTVEKAFLSTVSKEDKTPQVVNTQGGEMHKYMVQFKDQPVPGWIGILKKPGNEVKVGDELYGVVEENNWGKPQFTRMQLPQDGSVKLNSGAPAPQAAAPRSNSAPAPTTSGDTDAKLDYIIRILENARWFVDPNTKVPLGKEGPKDTVIDNIDDKPVDLSELEY